METVKRLFILLFVLLGYTAGAWAIEQDSDGYYLIGSVQDWKDFANIVQNANQGAVNARMTANIDLGDDQTHIGSSARYHGVFDGGGYTLTVNYVGRDYGLSPFRNTIGATIKNLHVDGSIVSTYSREPHTSGVISHSRGDDLIENVWVSVDMQSGGSGWLECAAFIGCNNSGNSRIINCLFTGSLTTTSGYYNGCFFGYADSGNVTITNCLSTGSFNYYGGSNSATRGIVDNSYVLQFPATIPESMQVTDEQLADGTIAAALGEAWVQDPLTHQPMLKIFATLKQDSEGYYLIGSVQDWQNFAAIVETTPTANAKMIADVDLGDDQTMVGTYHQKYQGTYDGQGHTLTFKYNTAGMSFEPEQRDLSLNFLGAAPFRDIEGATICNLHTAGSVTAEKIGASGLVGWTYGTNTIENCWSDVDIVSSNNTADTFAGFVAFQYGTQLNITDCVYTGKIQSASNISHAGFVAFQRYGKSSLNNCLLLLDEGSDVNTTTTQGLKYYTFVRNFESHNVANTINNCYYLTPFGVAQGTQATDDEISDGTTAAALQAEREEEIWVLDPVLGIPMLKLFANNITYKVPSSSIGTFSAKGQVLLPDGLTAYYCKTYNKENAAISVFGIDSNIVPAATGVLLEGEPGATFTLTGACGEAPTITDNELVAVPESTHINATDGAYTNFMMSGGKFIRIADESEDVKMPANRAYLPLLTDAVGNAKSVTLLWGATGIESLTPSTSQKDEGNIYNLNGQKLSSPLKGINIINGRKVIVK